MTETQPSRLKRSFALPYWLVPITPIVVYLATAYLSGIPLVPQLHPLPEDGEWQMVALSAAALALMLMLLVYNNLRQPEEAAARMRKAEADLAAQRTAMAEEEAERQKLKQKHRSKWELMEEQVRAEQAAKDRDHAERMQKRRDAYKRERLAELEPWFLWNLVQYRLSMDAVGTADPNQLAMAFLQHLLRQAPPGISLLAESENPHVRALLDRLPGYLVPMAEDNPLGPFREANRYW